MYLMTWRRKDKIIPLIGTVMAALQTRGVKTTTFLLDQSALSSCQITIDKENFIK